MTYFNGATVERWEGLARGCGIMGQAYSDRNAVDAHIQTALQSIFPNVKFKDKKRY